MCLKCFNRDVLTSDACGNGSSGMYTLFCLAVDSHSARMFEYASEVSATGEMKNIGTREKPGALRLVDRHSNKSYTTPEG